NALNFGLGIETKGIRPVEDRRDALNGAAGRARAQISRWPDAVIDRRVGFQLGKFKVLYPPPVQGDFSLGNQVCVKIARLRIDLRYQVGDVKIGRREIEEQLGFFAVAPPAAGADR